VTSCKVSVKANNLDGHTRQECWPDGASDACRRVETEYPGWRVWWGYGDHGPGYYAQPRVGTEVGTLHANNAYVLYSLIRHVEVGAP
jgi:hypothetical protein